MMMTMLSYYHAVIPPPVTFQWWESEKSNCPIDSKLQFFFSFPSDCQFGNHSFSKVPFFRVFCPISFLSVSVCPIIHLHERLLSIGKNLNQAPSRVEQRCRWKDLYQCIILANDWRRKASNAWQKAFYLCFYLYLYQCIILANDWGRKDRNAMHPILW